MTGWRGPALLTVAFAAGFAVCASLVDAYETARPAQDSFADALARRSASTVTGPGPSFASLVEAFRDSTKQWAPTPWDASL